MFGVKAFRYLLDIAAVPQEQNQIAWYPKWALGCCRVAWAFMFRPDWAVPRGKSPDFCFFLHVINVI